MKKKRADPITKEQRARIFKTIPLQTDKINRQQLYDIFIPELTKTQINKELERLEDTREINKILVMFDTRRVTYSRKE